MAENSLDQSMSKAKRHYRSLFFLPSFKKTVVLLAAVCVASGVLSYLLIPTSNVLAEGLLTGVLAFLLNLLFDWILTKSVFRTDGIFDIRRITVVSLFGWAFWFIFLILGTIAGAFSNYGWWVRLFLLGFAAVVTLRTIVFNVTAAISPVSRVFSILIQPFSSVLPFVFLWANMGISAVTFLPYLAFSPIIAFALGYVFLYAIARIGKKIYGVPSLNIFRAFLLNWVAGLNGPLEAFFESLGKDENIEVFLLKFDATKPKAAMIVPLVHPGPFKNIGSSLLPPLLKSEFQKKCKYEACVPLGLLGHELDATSQVQNQKIVDSVINSASFSSSVATATPYVSVADGFVRASCQAFGRSVLLSFTLAPKTTEDLPQELREIVRKEAAELGFDMCVAVNAHNSLTESTAIEASTEMLGEVASNCLRRVAVLPQFPFEVGAASVYPTEFGLREGMGTGGITALVVQVRAQKTAYVVIDGNNMISELRERILEALTGAGFQESEVFTTDTHAVSAVVLGSRGYHPVGEAMDPSLLISHILTAARKAASNIEPCKAGGLRLIVPKVRVIGSESIESLTVLTDRSIQRAKQIAAPVFGAEGLLLLLLLLLF